MKKPRLESYKQPEKLSQYPEAPCCRAGQLVTKNAGWRTMRPVVDKETCIGCFRCYLFCPDGVLYKNGKKVEIDYDYCKGCGICAKTCPVHAIKMEDE